MNKKKDSVYNMSERYNITKDILINEIPKYLDFF